jgi:hypothetical protein
MGHSSDNVATELWELVHGIRLPIKKAAARLGLPVAEAYELLAREKLRREERNLKWPVRTSP